jgi:hypothetical protein
MASHYKDRKKEQTFRFIFRYIALSLANSQYGDYILLIYPNEFEVKDHITLTATLKLSTEKLKNNLLDFTFLVVNFQFSNINIPVGPAH